ncbi:MAG TPA: hypothetical protein VIH68_00705 [Bacteroidota bacterium]
MGMTTLGWIFLVLIWSLVGGLVVICFYKVQKTGNKYKQAG